MYFLTKIIQEIPRSDVELAKKIGIGTRTIKRIKTGTYIPSKTVEEKIIKFLWKLQQQLKLLPILTINTKKDDTTTRSR